MRVLFIPLLTFVAYAQSGAPSGAAYWNTNGRYAGSEQCATCHAKQAVSFHTNTMSRALEPIEKCAVLQGDVRLIFRSGLYSWSILREGGRIIYRVTDGRETFEAPLQYAFGQGMAGQTYLFSHEGNFYESRVSYYAELHGLDLTVGAGNSKPRSLLEAAGRVMQGNEPRACFGCHTTGARLGPVLQLEHYENGVQCESCHGPGADHIAAVTAGKTVAGSIRSLRGIGPQESNEFCGVCHRTWETVMNMGMKGINTARFPAYRLTGSKCFSLDDPRISCTSCHDPHGPLVSEAGYYDSKCTACHNSNNALIGRKVCPVGKENCTNCHMPKVSPPEAHHAFSDHWIRIVRSKDEYPE